VGENVWHGEVPNEEQFAQELKPLRAEMLGDRSLRSKSLELLLAARKYKYAYHLRWMGVPIIRLAEDLLRQQEVMYSIKPDLVIEIGVARGGGLLFAASIQEISGLVPRVVGIDNRIFPHTRSAIEESRFRDQIVLVEADSDSSTATEYVRTAIANSESALLILDSDHSSDHVLEELRAYFPMLPVGSVVIVCDTIIDEFPAGTFPDRTWADGKGPGDAILRFMKEYADVRLENELFGDLLLSEIRGGILRKS
jgi:cephalosporin hydroxylase